jgi:hypothetical protein
MRLTGIETGLSNSTLRLSPTTMGKSIFSSPGATIHEGITSNRRGETQGTFAIPLSSNANDRCCSRVEEEIVVGSNHRGAEATAAGSGRSSAAGCGGAPGTAAGERAGEGRTPQVVAGGGAGEGWTRTGRGGARAQGFFPGERGGLFPGGSGDFFFVRPGDRSSRRRIISESRGDGGGRTDVEREGRRSFGE